MINAATTVSMDIAQIEHLYSATNIPIVFSFQIAFKGERKEGVLRDC